MSIEVTRIELPCAENHRGRKPVEWRIGDFVIPKHMVCSICEKLKATTKDQFIKLLDKSGAIPEVFMACYICRSCRSNDKKSVKVDKVEKVEKSVKVEKVEKSVKVETVENDKVSPLSKTNDRGTYILGLIVRGIPVRFKLEPDQGMHISLNCMTSSDQIHDFRNNICLKGSEMFDPGLFKNSKIYRSIDMENVIREIIIADEQKSI